MSDNETNDENKNQAKLNTSRYLVFNSTNELDLIGEINNLKREVADLKLKLEQKDIDIREKDLFIKDLHLKIEVLTNDEIKKLNEIIKDLKEEKQELLNTIKNQNKKIDELNEKTVEQSNVIKGLEKKFENMEDEKLKLEDEKVKMKEASFISDLTFQLYEKFLANNQDDETFIYLGLIKRNDDKTRVIDYDVRLFHKYLKNNNPKDQKLLDYIKQKFKDSVNKKSNGIKFTYEYNSEKYKTIVGPRNDYCHSDLKDITTPDEIFLHADEQIQKISKKEFKLFAFELIEQFRNLFEVEQQDDRDWLDWIETTLNSTKVNSFQDLSDGFILCRLINHLYPNLNVQYTDSKSVFKINANINSYLGAAEQLGICLFEQDDLKAARNQSKVRESVIALKKKSEE